MALGVLGAGNVGAAGTKLLVRLVPGILTLVPVAGWGRGWLPGGWRAIPTFYALVLLAKAALIWLGSPRDDRKPRAGRTLAIMVRPLRFVRVWRFGLYYAVVFGAYVFISAWLPTTSRRPTLCRCGPRRVTYGVFLMIAGLVPLCRPTQWLDLGVGGFRRS